MKLQFTLASTLITIAVLAIVLSYCINIPIIKPTTYMDSRYGSVHELHNIARNPTSKEIWWRFVRSGPPAFATTLAVLWAIRRLKSRRHTELPIG